LLWVSAVVLANEIRCVVKIVEIVPSVIGRTVAELPDQVLEDLFLSTANQVARH